MFNITLHEKDFWSAALRQSCTIMVVACPANMTKEKQNKRKQRYTVHSMLMRLTGARRAASLALLKDNLSSSRLFELDKLDLTC